MSASGRHSWVISELRPHGHPPGHLDEPCYVGVPPLVVEVICGSWVMDLVTKLQKYAAAGAPRYWLVDLRDRTLLALVLVDGIYEVAAQLDEGNPAADLETGAGQVRVDLAELFA